MDIPYPPEAWRRLGKELERRRGQLGYGFRQRGIFLRDRGGTMSEKTLARLERGERMAYPDATIAAVEALYGWEPGSVQRVLDGESPVLTVPDPAHGQIPGLIRQLWPDQAERLWSYSHVRTIWQTPRLPEDAKVALTHSFAVTLENSSHNGGRVRRLA